MGTSIARSILGAAALAWVMAGYPPARGGDEKKFRGEIADTQCALNVHSLSQSHKEMIAMKPEVKTNADCARYCVKERGGRFVLQTPEKVYKLDTQALAEQWAGLKVKIVGTLDRRQTSLPCAPLSRSPRARASYLLRSDG